LIDRFIEHYRLSITEYNGWQGSEFESASGAFIRVLTTALGEDDFERFCSAIARSRLNDVIVDLKPAEVERYRSMSDAELLARYYNKSFELKSAPPGPQIARLRREQADLAMIALSRGISTLSVDYEDLIRSIPGLTKKGYAALYRIAQGPLSSDNVGMFEQTYRWFAKKYLEAKGAKRDAYALGLQFLSAYAGYYSLSTDDLKERLWLVGEKYGLPLVGLDKVANLAELYRRGTVELSPAGLPAEIKEILIRTGYWELVSRYLKNIGFTPEIDEEDSSVSFDANGMAFSHLGRVTIDYLNPDGTRVPAWEIAAILLHEAAHVEWGEQPAILRQSTFSERHSYAVENEFFDRYEAAFGLPENGADFVFTRNRIIRNIQSANLLLGYPDTDLDPQKTALPSAEYCRSRGIDRPEDLDLEFHPNFPSPDFLTSRSELDSLLARYGINDADQETVDLVWEILQGSATVEFSLNTASNKTTAVYVVRQGREQLLSREKFSALYGLFFTVATASALPLRRGPGFVLRLIGDPVLKMGAAVKMEINATSLRSLLFRTSAFLPAAGQ
jgi:hypothetical protein